MRFRQIMRFGAGRFYGCGNRPGKRQELRHHGRHGLNRYERRCWQGRRHTRQRPRRLDCTRSGRSQFRAQPRTGVHQNYSETYGGRNTKARQSKDAADLRTAVNSNVDAIKRGLLEEGFSELDIEAARQQLHDLNRAQGWY